MKNSEVRIRVDGGFLVSHRNEDPDYDGMHICFESDDGDITDIVFVETNPRNNNKVIDVYNYADVHSKNSTSAFSIKTEDFKEATGTNSLLLKTIKEIEDLNYETKSITQNSDTILTDLLDKAKFKFPGISHDIFNIFEKSKDKEAVKEMFFEFVGIEFEEYLVKCLEEIPRGEDLSDKFLVTAVKTYKHTYLVKADSKEEAIDIVNEEYGGICQSTDSFSEEYFARRPNKSDDLDLYETCS